MCTDCGLCGRITTTLYPLHDVTTPPRRPSHYLHSATHTERIRFCKNTELIRPHPVVFLRFKHRITLTALIKLLITEIHLLETNYCSSIFIIRNIVHAIRMVFKISPTPAVNRRGSQTFPLILNLKLHPWCPSKDNTIRNATPSARGSLL